MSYGRAAPSRAPVTSRCPEHLIARTSAHADRLRLRCQAPLLHAIAAGRTAAQPPREQPEQQQQRGQPLAIEVRAASSPAELRAAGYLRAVSFYTYPPDRSEFSARMHRRMKGDAEWESVTRKVAGIEPSWAGMRVTCLVAVLPDVADCSVAQQAAEQLDASAKLPAEDGMPPGIVVGSLDLNVGAVLPAEELIGRQPSEGAALRRAYLSNVCVARAAQRRGVAAALMRAAEELARKQGVHHMYVHVVADNVAAAALYEGQGYSQEAEESESYARALRRPRRRLLHLALS